MALELPESVGLSSLDKPRLGRSNSLWPMPFATACCGIELMATGASKHDIARRRGVMQLSRGNAT